MKTQKKPAARPARKVSRGPKAKGAASRPRAPGRARPQQPKAKGKAQVKAKAKARIQPKAKVTARSKAAAPVVVRTPVPENDPSRQRAIAIAKAGLAKKAEDVLVLDVHGLTGYADYVVIMSADSEPQASAIADAVDVQLKSEGASKVGVEGHSGGRWVLIDYGDVVAHVFHPEARSFYDIEGLWADAPRIVVKD